MSRWEHPRTLQPACVCLVSRRELSRPLHPACVSPCAGWEPPRPLWPDCVSTGPKEEELRASVWLSVPAQEGKDYKPLADCVALTQERENYQSVTDCGSLAQEDWTALSTVWKKFWRSNLGIHVETVHRVSAFWSISRRPLTCSQCDESFTTRPNLSWHNNKHPRSSTPLVHLEISRPLQCVQCGKKLRTVTKMNRHK